MCVCVCVCVCVCARVVLKCLADSVLETEFRLLNVLTLPLALLAVMCLNHCTAKKLLSLHGFDGVE